MIWLVTGHEATRRALARLVEEKGYSVELFDCTDNILPRLKFQTPALIVLDCGITRSFEVLGNVRAAPTRKPVPVVMFSVDEQNLRERATAAGAHAYVPKGSLDWAELLTEIVRFAGLPPERPAQ